MKYLHLISFIFLFISCKDENLKIYQGNSGFFISENTFLTIDSLVNKNTKEIDFKNLSVLSFSDIKGIKEIKDKNIVDKINRSCIIDDEEDGFGNLPDSCLYNKLVDKINSIKSILNDISFDIYYLIENKKNSLLIKKSKHFNDKIWDDTSISLDYGYYVTLYSYYEKEIIDSVIIYQQFAEIEHLTNGERIYYIDDFVNVFTIDMFYSEDGILCVAWNQHQLKMKK